MVKEIDARINEIDKEIEDIKSKEVVDEAQIYVLKRERHDLVKMCKNLDPHDKVYLARHKKRPKITEYIDASKRVMPLAKKTEVFLAALQPSMVCLLQL